VEWLKAKKEKVMRPWRSGIMLVVALLFVYGCGDGRIKARGRIVKNGEPFTLSEGEGMRIVFVPTDVSGATYDSYVAVFEKDGSFKVTGKDGQGLPPGKYRVDLEHLKKKKDLFKGAFAGKRSPIVREVSRGSGEIVIDLDHPGT
jgi:hypothetical protein